MIYPNSISSVSQATEKEIAEEQNYCSELVCVVNLHI